MASGVLSRSIVLIRRRLVADTHQGQMPPAQTRTLRAMLAQKLRALSAYSWHGHARLVRASTADDSHFRQRHDELAAVGQKGLLSLEELVKEVPREREVVIGVLGARLLLADDRNLRTDGL
jgi:hypothetical protein